MQLIYLNSLPVWLMFAYYPALCSYGQSVLISILYTIRFKITLLVILSVLGSEFTLPIVDYCYMMSSLLFDAVLGS